MKRKILIATPILIVLVFAVNVAFAASSFEAFYPVLSWDGKTTPTPQFVFDYDTTPYIYLKLPDPGDFDFFSDVSTTWSFDDELKDTEGSSSVTQLEFLLASDEWLSIRQPGIWTIDGTFELSGLFPSISGAGTTSFTVNAVPEPIGTILFLLGGTALVLRRHLHK